MTPSNTTDDPPPAAPSSVVREDGVEYGYIWSTTGGGKPLTSFNASTLATMRDSDNSGLPKLLSRELSIN